MTIRTYKVTLDTKNSIAPEPVFLRQGDKTGAVVIDATLMDNGSPVSLSGLTPMFKANTADGQAVIADSTGFTVTDSANGKFTYQVPNALAAVPGKITTAYFSFSDSSGSESTFDVAFIIKKAVDITQAQADDYITIIDGTIQSLQQKIDAMDTDMQTIINAYNSNAFYSRNDIDAKPFMQYKDTAGTLTTAATNNGTTVHPRTEWLGLTDMPRNTAYNYGQGLRQIAHRGNNAEWPENSLPAFRHTGRFWGIETDTSVTSDGTWVIMHDDTVDRMTNGTGAIKDMTYAQIAALRLDSGTNVAGCRADELVVPRLTDYLRVCKEIGKVPILEIKPTTTYTANNYDNLASIIRKLGWESQMWIISFGFTNLQEMRKRIPNLPVQWLVSSYSDAAVDQVAALGANVAIDTGTMQNVTEANVTYAHNKGVMFNVWTGKDNTNVESLANIGVDFLTKNGLSGDRKYSVLTLKNGWAHMHADNPWVAETSVAQIGSGYVHLSLNVKNGTTTKGDEIANLPDWATPYNTIWSHCVIRTSSGVVSGTLDIIGRSNESRPPAVKVGIAWDQMNSNSGWAAAEITYYVGQ
jgi:glycerophosphoryl diester phosphodiesterase